MLSLEKQDIFTAVVDVVATTLHIEKKSVTLASTLQDLGADSLSMVEIILKLEEKCGISIDDEKAEHLVNMNDLVNYIYEVKNA